MIPIFSKKLITLCKIQSIIFTRIFISINEFNKKDKLRTLERMFLAKIFTI